ncbi:MAG: NADH-quinone oxidoreductase subunit I [Verrucomicrobia bacterium]|nr:NADH-quinone oxidoreductase subunit I [Verrucomicrobiota bacterium]
MIVERKELTLLEKTYLPGIAQGIRITTKHFIDTVTGRRKVTMQYPEEKWTVPDGYRGAPYLVKDQEGRTKCVSCQLCEFICPPKAIKITPPGPSVNSALGGVEKCPEDFEINMLRCIFCGMCQEVCPEEAIFLMRDYSLTGESREEMIYHKDKLLTLGGTHQDAIQKWKKKESEAQAQAPFH